MDEKPDSNSPQEETGREDMPEISSNRDLLIYLFLQIKRHRKWWLLPLLFVLAFLALFVSLTGNSSILPAIYALF